MSVGVVLPRAAFQALPRLDDQSQLDRMIAETPGVANLMTRAERRWPVRVERDFSFGSKSYAGDRWVLVGDAGSFLDPVFSTGVAIAMESGLEAARAIDRALSRGDVSASAFETYNRRQRARYLSFRRFVLGFYQPGFRELLFNPDPPQRMYRAVVTTLAGYWQPSLATRIWLKLFFLAAAAQERFRFLAPTDRK
jgi:2-polyprenyl-6-methoxyphenol hydroxylase-like FAD-dependent oxidoreductase